MDDARTRPLRAVTKSQPEELFRLLPESVWVNGFNGKPCLTREEWQQQGRLRKRWDVFRKRDPLPLPPESR